VGGFPPWSGDEFYCKANGPIYLAIIDKCFSGCQKVLFFGTNSLKQINFPLDLIDCLCAPRISTNTGTRVSPHYKRGILTRALRSSCKLLIWLVLRASPPSYWCNQKLPGTESSTAQVLYGVSQAQVPGKYDAEPPTGSSAHLYSSEKLGIIKFVM